MFEYRWAELLSKEINYIEKLKEQQYNKIFLKKIVN